MLYPTHKILVVCGPTAVGKTKLALELAGLFGGELVCADARQIYKGLDILSGKDIPSGYSYKLSGLRDGARQLGYFGNGTKIWLVSHIEISATCTAYDYQRAATIVISDIQARGMLPVLVGGTGLYINSLLDSFSLSSVKPDYHLRRILNNKPVDYLRDLLQKHDPSRLASMNRSDRANPRRLIRAIEIAAEKNSEKARIGRPQYDYLMVGLTAPMHVIEKRIADRIDDRINRGVLNEAYRIMPELKPDMAVYTELGLPILMGVINRKLSLAEAKKKWFVRERRYVKRQLTWFKKDKKIILFDVSRPSAISDIIAVVKSWYTYENAD